MPVAVKDLLAGKPALRADERPALMLAHLREHADHAFAAGQLAKLFNTDLRTLRSVLARLQDRGVIDKKGDDPDRQAPWVFALFGRSNAVKMREARKRVAAWIA